MGFVKADLGNLCTFNSSTSSRLLNIYEEAVSEEILQNTTKPKSKTFAPSSVRCPRISWFRLRGVQPDKVLKPDTTLDFTANMGTACHEMIQRRLKHKLKSDWIDVSEYLASLNPRYTYSVDVNNYETMVIIDNPPVKFAVDGILRIDGEIYLLEIKSSEFSSWNKLDSPKKHHINQIQCYAALLNIKKVLMIYIDRQYGGVKCFEQSFSMDDRNDVWKMFKYVQDMVDSNLAPPKLNSGDPWCTPSMCVYYQKCQQLSTKTLNSNKI